MTRIEKIEREVEALTQEELAKFRAWIQAQGGDVRAVDDPTLLPQAPLVMPVPAPRSGHVAGIDAREVGLTCVALGAGRERKGDPIDPAVGIVLGPKVGDRVQAGETLFTVHARDRDAAEAASQRLLAAYDWSNEPVLPPVLIHDVLYGG